MCQQLLCRQQCQLVLILQNETQKTVTCRSCEGFRKLQRRFQVGCLRHMPALGECANRPCTHQEDAAFTSEGAGPQTTSNRRHQGQQADLPHSLTAFSLIDPDVSCALTAVIDAPSGPSHAPAYWIPLCPAWSNSLQIICSKWTPEANRQRGSWTNKFNGSAVCCRTGDYHYPDLSTEVLPGLQCIQ